MNDPAPSNGAHEIAFEAFGVRVIVGVPEADQLARVQALLPPGWRPCEATAEDKRFEITPDDEEEGKYQFLRGEIAYTDPLDLDLALTLLEAQVRAYVALHAPDRIFVHAGVVATNDRAIVLPGMSFAGKTTLVAALVRAGALYYSDEFAVLDEDGLVHPYAKPLSLRGANQVQVDHHVNSLGGTQGDGALPVGAVVVTTYRRGAEWKPEPGTSGQGVLALLNNTVAAQHRPAEVMHALTRAVEGATVIQSERGDADELAPALLEQLR